MKCPQCQTDNSSDSVFCRKCGFPLSGPDKASFTRTITYQRPIFGLNEDTLFAERYRIKEELGSGGMGKVYRVIDETIDEEIALKLIKPEIASDKRTILRFKNELKLSRKISHKNVCRMYHLGEEEGLPFITMEFVKGKTLKSIIQTNHDLTMEKTIDIARQICEGLAEAHKHGVVHRDLKPGNVMIDDNGAAKIMDFGIARSVMTETITESGMMVGTLEYMSPEQAGGEKADNRSDIYSLGVIIYEMLTGDLPFRGETPISTALKHQTELPPPPKEKNPEIPESLNKIVLKCLAKPRGKRYQTVEELQEDLNRTSRGEGIESLPSEGKRKGWLFIAVPAVVFLLLASIYFIFLKGVTEKNSLVTPEVSQIVQKKEQAQPAEDLPEQIPQAAEDKTATQDKPTAPLPGILEIGSTPSGAEVQIDGKRAGQTPFRGEYLEGSHSIRLRKAPDYKDVTASLEVRSGETLKKAYSLPPNYALKIESTPGGADVWIDGISFGQTPLEIDLSKDRIQLAIEKNSFAPVNETKTLNQGENSFHYTLQKTLYRLILETVPGAASVAIDDQVAGITPIETAVASGSHRIKIEKAGYKPIEESFNIEKDESKAYTLEETAEKTETVELTGKISIKVLPFADVFIDGVLIGEVPPNIVQDVRPGKHQLEFVSTSLSKKHSVELEIASGENVEVRMNMNTGESEIVKKRPEPTG